MFLDPLAFSLPYSSCPLDELRLSPFPRCLTAPLISNLLSLSLPGLQLPVQPAPESTDHRSISQPTACPGLASLLLACPEPTSCQLPLLRWLVCCVPVLLLYPLNSMGIIWKNWGVILKSGIHLLKELNLLNSHGILKSSKDGTVLMDPNTIGLFSCPAQ